jgi:hypothetical protein
MLFIILFILVAVFIIYYPEFNKKKEPRIITEAVPYPIYLKIKKPFKAYLACDKKNKIFFTTPDKHSLYLLKKGNRLKEREFLTLGGYTSVYNVEYPVVLDNCNKPLFNTFRIKKYKKSTTSIYIQTKNGYYIGYNYRESKVVFTKDKRYALIFKIEFKPIYNKSSIKNN